MNSLNSEQQKAVEIVNGPILILAGAGSGKTRTLTQRISYLIENNYARAENILAVTFTNKASNEMKERIMKQLNIRPGTERVFLPWVGTFHSICVQILKRDGKEIGITGNFTIYDTTDQKDLVRKAIKKLNFNEKKINPGAVLSTISSAKCNLISPGDYHNVARGYFESQVAEIYSTYQKLLESNSGLDFDDLIMKTVVLLQKNPSILEKYQELFRFILVDEYQDTNHSQYVLTKLLAKKYRNICVVGDDAQSIYSFRGASITNILNFEKDYPDAKIIKLEQNYRSTKKILEASNEIIRHNPEQKQKKLWTENNEGEAILIYDATDEHDEAKWIATKVKELLLENINPKEIAVLYRTNAMSRNLEEALLNTNINYRIVGGVRFYHRTEIKVVLAYLRVIFNPNDTIALIKAISNPRRGIGAKTIEKYTLLANQQRQGLLKYLSSAFNNSPDLLQKNILEFTRIMIKLRDLSTKEPVSDLIEDILEFSGYRAELKESGENESRLENIQELKSLARKFDPLDYPDGLEKFLEEVALIESSYESSKDDREFITLMTVHSAKGLEFDYVFIAGMEENLFPHSNSKFDPQELAEERRLAYVAITRARQQVMITHAESRLYFGSRNSNPVSRFIEDIPENLLMYYNVFTGDDFGSESRLGTNSSSDWRELEEESESIPVAINLKKGDLVKHELFGIGEVVDVDDFIILIRFSVGLKELALEYVKLEKI